MAHTARSARARRVVALVVALVVLAATGPAAGQSPSTGATSTTAPTTTRPAGAATTGVLEVVAQTPSVRPGETFTITLRTTGVDVDCSDGECTRIQLAVGQVSAGAPLAETRQQLRSTDSAQQELVKALLERNVVSRRPVEARQVVDANGLLTLSIPTRGPATTAAQLAADPPPILLSPGIWPVAVEVRNPGQAAQTVLTHLVLTPEAPASPPLSVTVVVPLAADRPPLRPDQRVVLDALDRSRLRTLIGRVQAFPTVVLAVSPQLIDALERSSDSEDAALLAQLRTLTSSNAVLALPYVDVDVEAWRTAGLVDEVRGLFSSGRVTLTRVLGVDPVADTIITPPSTTPETLRFLAEMGYSRFVFSESQLEPLRREQWPSTVTKTFVVRDSDGEARAGIVADPELRRLFAGDSVLNAHRLVADLAAAWFEGANATTKVVRDERRGVIVVVPDDWSASAQFLNVVTTALTANPILRPAGLSMLFDSSPASRAGDQAPLTLVDGVLERRLVPTAPRSLEQYPVQLREANTRLGSFETMLASDPRRTPVLRTLLLVSGDQRLDPTERSAYLDRVTGVIDEATAGISFARSSTYTLTSRTDTIPLIVQNSTTTTLKGRIELRTDPRLEFPELERAPGSVWLLQDIEIAPGVNRYDVRVRTRTSGESSFEAIVTSPDGGLGPLASTRLRVRSVALSGVGLGISIVALAVLLTWWVRHHRGTRRSPTTVA